MLAGMGLFVVFSCFGQRFLPFREKRRVRNAGGEGSVRVFPTAARVMWRGMPLRRCTVDLCRLSLK